MYINSGSGPTQSTPTTAQLATLKAYVTANNQSGGSMYQFTAAQIVAVLNAPTSVPNPQPLAVVVDPILPSAFQGIVATIAANLSASQLPPATQLALIQAVDDLLVLQGQTPLPLNDPKLAAVVAQFEATGFTAAQASAVLMVPANPPPPVTLVGLSWAYTNLGEAWVEVADVVAALAS